MSKSIVEQIRNNRWVVSIDGDLKINPYDIIGMSFNSDKKELSLMISDNELVPIKDIDKCYNNYTELDIILSFLLPNGDICYTEKYSGCKIVSYNHCDICYNDDNCHKIKVNFNYSQHKIV